MEAAVKAQDRMLAAGWNWEDVGFAAGDSFGGLRPFVFEEV